MKKLKKLVKNLLAIPFVRKMYEGLSKAIASLGSLSRITSVVYHWLAFFNFSREQYAVLYGRKDYYKNLKRERKTHTELRRNIHRLEKGIIMQPRRPVFARDYIEETVEFYERAVEQYKVSSTSIDESELQWAQNVLTNYFETVDTSDANINKLRKRFEEIAYQPPSEEKIPFKRGTRKSAVKYDDLLSLAMQRRSVRWFEQKKVPRDLIDKALMVGRQSPSACNRLPYEFRIFDEPEKVKKVAGIPFGAAGYSHNIPTIIVVVGKLESYFSPRDRHVIYIDAALAAMPFMMALETLGLASSVINWPDFEPLERKMQKAIGLKPDERPIMLIAVGYPDKEGMIPFSQKKSLDVLRSYNKMKSDE